MQAITTTRYKEDGSRTRGTLGIAEFEVAPNVPTPPPHIHHAHEEGFYVLEGELNFLVGTETVLASKGSYVTVRFLNTFTPPQYLNYVEELSTIMATSGAPNPVQMRDL